MEEFLYQIERENAETHISIRGFFINTEGKEIQKIFKVPFVINILENDFKQIELKSSDMWKVKGSLKSPKNQKILQVEFYNKELYNYTMELIKAKRIVLYEKDLSPGFRLLIEGKVPIYTGGKDRYVSSKEIKNAFTILSLDIETLGRGDELRVGMVSCFLNGFCSVYVNEKETDIKKVGSLEFENVKVIACKTEEELLKKLKEDIIKFSPQIIIGWNVINFDFDLLKKRFETYNFPFNLSSIKGKYKLKTSKSFFSKSYLTFPKVLVLDGIQTLRSNFFHFEEYGLDFVASKVLGKNKTSLDDETEEEDKIQQIEKLFKENPKKLIEYNVRDTVLVTEIFEKLKLIELMISRSCITTTPLEKISSPIASLDIMYLKELHRQGKVANTNSGFNTESRILGASVFEPEKGFYEDVFVFDFKSLYPNIIITFNIDPFSLILKNEVKNFSENEFIKTPKETFISKKIGILPQIIKQLGEQREIAKQEKDSVKSHAIKITMNSFYGALASPRCRFYNHDLAESITMFGRSILQKAKEYISNNFKAKVIYGDTDSVFVCSLKKFNCFEDKKNFGEKLQKEINSYFKKWVKDEFGVKSFLEIEFEKIYSSFFIASKKRYAGFNETTEKRNL